MLWPRNSRQEMLGPEVVTVTPSTIHRRLPQESSCGPAGSAHRLGHVISSDVTLQMTINDEEGGRQGITKIKLRQVPNFLIEAFNYIINSGLQSEGLFRREGNASRLNQNNYLVYLGDAGLPTNFTVHDICSMVKRFFRDLKEPLLPNGGLRKALLDLAQKNEETPVTREEFHLVFDPGYEKAKKNLDYSLPPAHMGTLGYLMRQLNGIARHSDKNQMDAANLATVFAPTLFREEKDKKKKERRGSQEDLLTTLRGDTRLQIAAVKMMIERANWIGIHPNCYVTSSHPHPRSSSAAPSPRQPLVQTAPSLREPPACPPRKDHSKGNGTTVQPSLGRGASLKVKNEAKSKVASSRRSSSAFKDIIHGIGERLRRRSQSREGDKSCKAERRASSPAVVVPADRFDRNSNLPVRRTQHMLEIADSKTSAAAHSDNATANSSRFRETATRQSRLHQSTFASTSKQSAPFSTNTQSRVSTTTSSHSSGRSSRQNYESAAIRRDSGKKHSNSPPCIPAKVLRDAPVSMLGEEHFNPSYREHHERSRRRHTTPVKTSTALRRNQPNTRHSGLQQPKRRATVVNAHEQEKENRSCLRSSSVSRKTSSEDVGSNKLEEDSLGLGDSAADILTQKGHESRLRRVRRQQRREQLNLLFQDSSSESVVFSESFDSKDPVKKRVTKVDASCSPIIFHDSLDSKAVRPQQTHGSAVVGETVVVTPVSATYPLADDSLRDALPTDLRETPPPQEPRRSPPRLPLHSPPRTGHMLLTRVPSKEDRVHSAIGEQKSESTDVVFRVPSLPIPDHFNPELRNAAKKDVHVEKNIKHLGEATSQRPGLRGKSRVTPMSNSFGEERTISSAARCLRSNSLNDPDSEPTNRLTNDSFVVYNDIRDAILSSHEAMDARMGRHVYARPSVALIQKQGIVKDRVNLFRQLGSSMSVPLETNERSSTSRSSLGAAASVASDEEFVKPSAPPVTHSLTMGTSRRSSAATASNSQISSYSSPK